MLAERQKALATSCSPGWHWLASPSSGLDPALCPSSWFSVAYVPL